MLGGGCFLNVFLCVWQICSRTARDLSIETHLRLISFQYLSVYPSAYHPSTVISFYSSMVLTSIHHSMVLFIIPSPSCHRSIHLVALSIIIYGSIHVLYIIHPSFYCSIYHSIIHPSCHRSIHLVALSIHCSIVLSIYHSIIHPSIHRLIVPFTHHSIFPFIHHSLHPYIVFQQSIIHQSIH